MKKRMDGLSVNQRQADDSSMLASALKEISFDFLDTKK